MCFPCFPLLIRDHARGNEALVKEVPGLRVYGGDDRIGGLTDKVASEQELKVRERNVCCGKSVPEVLKDEVLVHKKCFNLLAKQMRILGPLFIMPC